MIQQQLAPAKINLSLHVTGRRADGYHLLQSLVVFADFGDTLRVELADQMALNVTGPMAAGVPMDHRNLAWRAAALFDRPASIGLEKHLPAEAGIGGGSADAAAVIRAMTNLTGTSIDLTAQAQLGADVPVCVLGQAAVMQGIGEQIQPIANCPSFHAVMVNPGARLSTPSVFSALQRPDNPAMIDLPQTRDPAVWLDWLRNARNDLQAPAIALAPVIATCLDVIADGPGCLLARMSGSGATCFGLYANAQQAAAAADDIASAHPDWWVRACQFNAAPCGPS